MTYQWEGENNFTEFDRALLSAVNMHAVEVRLEAKGWSQQIHDSAEYAVELGLYDWRNS